MESHFKRLDNSRQDCDSSLQWKLFFMYRNRYPKRCSELEFEVGGLYTCFFCNTGIVMLQYQCSNFDSIDAFILKTLLKVFAAFYEVLL